MILSCGIVPVRFVKTSDLAACGKLCDGCTEVVKPEVLLLRNYKHWDFPKGCTEEGEDPLTCALRELREEAGLDRIEFKWGSNKFHETPPYSKPKKTARYYVAQVPPDSVVRILPNPLTGIIEHQEYRWCGFEDAQGLLKPRIQQALDFARQVVGLTQTKET